MIKSPFKPGRSVEERLNFLETIAMRLARRGKSSVKSVLFPYTISEVLMSPTIKGNVLNYMFPCDGTLAGAVVSVVGAELVELVIKLTNNGTVTKEFIVTPNKLDLEFEYRVTKGTKLSIDVNTLSVEINELWLNIIWLPDLGTSRIKNFLLNELDKTIDEEGIFK